MLAPPAVPAPKKRSRVFFWRRAAKGRRKRSQASGWVFGGLTVLPAVLAVAWLLPGLPLVLSGRFTAMPMVFIAAPVAVGLGYVVLRRVPSGWPAPMLDIRLAETRPAETRPAEQAEARRVAVPWWTVAATVLVAATFAAWQIWMRTQQIIYLRDPATYLQVGYWIAHHGSLPVPQLTAAFGGSHPGLSFASMNYYPRGAGIVPQFMTGFPVVLAGAIWAGGLPAALLITPIIGGCAILSFGGLAGRLLGARWAPAAAVLLALSLPEIYTSRSTFSEPLTQVMLFGGLSMLADSLLPRRRYDGQEAVAAVAGLTLGLTIFVRLDALSDILPVIPFLGLLIAARKRQTVPFFAGLVVGAVYGALDGYKLSRPYLNLEAPSLRPLAVIAGAAALLTVIGVVFAVSPWVRGLVSGALLSRIARLLGRWRWLPEAAAVVTVLVFIGFAVRPLVQKVAGETDPTSIAYVAELQKLARLPVDGRQQYYQDSLYWVIWYVGLPTVLLGAVGLAALVRKSMRTVFARGDDPPGPPREGMTRKDPEGAAWMWALPLMIALWVIVTVLWRPAVSPDQPWASRRLVPFVLPGFILGALWVSAWLKTRAIQLGAGRATSAAAAFCCVGALAIPSAWTTFGIGLTPRPTSHGMAFKRIGAGELTAVRRLCGELEPDSSVVILDQLTADRFAQVVRGICGIPTAVMSQPTPSTVRTVVEAISAAGRQPILLAESETQVSAYGGTPREIVNLATAQEAHLLNGPPARTWGIHYTVWMSTPAQGQGEA